MVGKEVLNTSAVAIQLFTWNFDEALELAPVIHTDKETFCVLIFCFFHKSSVGFKSCDWLGHSNDIIFFLCIQLSLLCSDVLDCCLAGRSAIVSLSSAWGMAPDSSQESSARWLLPSYRLLFWPTFWLPGQKCGRGAPSSGRLMVECCSFHLRIMATGSFHFNKHNFINGF